MHPNYLGLRTLINKIIFICPLFISAFGTSVATASVHADLSARTVTGKNDGSGVVNITNGLETRKTFSQAAKSPPGTKNLPFGTQKTAPMTEAGFLYYFNKFTSLRGSRGPNNQPGISDELKQACMQARDFVGCIQALGGTNSKEDSGELVDLRNSMKKVSARLFSGTSLRDSSLVFQPVVDSLSLAVDIYPEALAVRAAAKASSLFDILQSAWQGRIDSLNLVSNYIGPDDKMYSCSPTQTGVDRMNACIGSQAVTRMGRLKDSMITDLWAGGSCTERIVEAYEFAMMKFDAGVLKEGAVDPAEMSRYEKDRQTLYRISRMEAWEKRLEQNPGLKAWAAANPAMASKEQAKYNRDNPQKELNIPAYTDTLKYLSKFNPPL